MTVSREEFISVMTPINRHTKKLYNQRNAEIYKQEVIKGLIKLGVAKKEAGMLYDHALQTFMRQHQGNQPTMLFLPMGAIYNEMKAQRLVESRKKGASDYAIYHDTYSSAVQHAAEKAKARGYEVDEDDWFSQVATGPKKPSKDKTNSLSVQLSKNGKPVNKRLQMQVTNLSDRKYELNMYIESIDQDTTTPNLLNILENVNKSSVIYKGTSLMESVGKGEKIKVKLKSGKIISAIAYDGIDPLGGKSSFTVTAHSQDLDMDGPKRDVKMEIKKSQIVTEKVDSEEEEVDEAVGAVMRVAGKAAGAVARGTGRVAGRVAKSGARAAGRAITRGVKAGVHRASRQGRADAAERKLHKKKSKDSYRQLKRNQASQSRNKQRDKERLRNAKSELRSRKKSVKLRNEGNDNNPFPNALERFNGVFFIKEDAVPELMHKISRMSFRKNVYRDALKALIQLMVRDHKRKNDVAPKTDLSVNGIFVPTHHDVAFYAEKVSSKYGVDSRELIKFYKDFTSKKFTNN